MPTLTRPSKILAPNGQPASMFLYPSPRTNAKAYKPRYWLSQDTRQNVTEYDRQELVNYSRQLRAQIDILATAIEQKNNWAFGDAWEPHYSGENKAWAESAAEFLNFQFYPSCNVRGQQFDMRTSLKLMGQAWDVDGDDLMVLTETESHFPQIAFFPATRVGTYGKNAKGYKKAGEVDGGPFDGLKIFDGVILNKNNKMVAGRVLNDDGTHTDISSYSCDLGFEPSWCDQVRGIPRIATSLLRWMDLQDIDGFLQAGVKRASKVGLKVKNAEGEAGVGNEVITEEDSPTAPTDERKIHYEEVTGSGGEIWYLDVNTGEEIEPFTYNNPHPNVEALIQRVQRGSLASVGWFYELLQLNEGGRAPSRLLCDLANQTIWDRQATALRRWKRVITYALAKAAKHGYIKKPSDPMDYARWEPGLPKHISVDAGNDAKIALDAIKMGTSTKGIEAAKAGYHRDQIRRERLKELKDLVADTMELMAASNNQLNFDAARELLEQRSPNPAVQQPQQAQGGGEEE